MPRHKEVFPIRKLAGNDQVPLLAKLRDFCFVWGANVDAKVNDPLEKLAHYKLLAFIQTSVTAELAKLTAPQKPVTPAMKPLL